MSKKAVLKAYPSGLVGHETFDIVEDETPAPGEGEFIVNVEAISIDPAMRGWLVPGKSYIPPVQPGEVMRALGAGHVETSNHPDFAEGDAVIGTFGVQERAVSDGRGVTKVDTSAAPLERWIGGLGMPGLTAYFGLLHEGRPQAGETVLVSAASGAVGSVVAQIAKIKGCRVVGIAGGSKKVAYLRDELGLDGAVDYKQGMRALHKGLKEACPDGVDVLFENVGGPVFDTEVAHMNIRGRIVLCGLIADYNAGADLHGFKNIRYVLTQRLTMQGIVVFDYREHYADAVREMLGWVNEGKLRLREDVREGGVEAFVDTLNLLYSGGNEGKLVLRM